MPDSFYKKYGKRIFDVVFGMVSLLLLSPFFFILGIFIKISDGGSVIYKQARVGKDFQNFFLYKFRTMIENSENTGLQLTGSGDPRITPIGLFLRKYKLDELPQLWNVVKGDLSFVGPRPEVKKYVDSFEADYDKILKIRPGITDYAAIEFRDEAEKLKKYQNIQVGYLKEILPQKIKLYYKYLDDISFKTDVKLILKTIWKIFE